MAVLSSTPAVSQSAYEEEIEHHLQIILPAFDTSKPDAALLVLLSMHDILHNMLNSDLISLAYCRLAWATHFSSRFVSLANKIK